MILLAIETATPTASVALADNDRLLAEISASAGRAHSERLPGMIEPLLADCSLAVTDIGAVAVSIGPGSFTGLRIGLSFAKGLSYSLGLPLVGVPTLKALALVAGVGSQPVCPMLDARKGQVYGASYLLGGPQSPKTLLEEGAYDPQDFIGSCAEGSIFIGEGALVYEEVIRQTHGQSVEIAPPHLAAPRAAAVAALAFAILAEDGPADAAGLTPVYHRLSEAELARACEQ